MLVCNPTFLKTSTTKKIDIYNG